MARKTINGRHPLEEALRADHTPEAIERRLAVSGRPSYVKDAVYGAMDGTVTTFAVVAAAHGAHFGMGVVLIVGAANLVADGFSMAAGNFLGTRAEMERRARVRREEEAHVRLIPEGEREEVRQIFAAKGFTGADLESAVRVITADHKRWVETMLSEEHGFPRFEASPLRAGATTFAAFVAAGALPLLPYALAHLAGVEPVAPFGGSALMAALAFFSIGAAKGRFVGRAWWSSGLSSLGLGGAAAALAYAAGVLLQGLA